MGRPAARSQPTAGPRWICMNALGCRIVHAIPLCLTPPSTSRLYPTNGAREESRGSRDVYTKRATPAARAAATRASVPSRSTLVSESPGRRDRMPFAVVSTASTPAQAARKDGGSLRSPRAMSTPRSRSHASRGEPSRTNPRTGCPRACSCRQISPPRSPVDPTTRIMGRMPRPPRSELLPYLKDRHTADLGAAYELHVSIIENVVGGEDEGCPMQPARPVDDAKVEERLRGDGARVDPRLERIRLACPQTEGRGPLLARVAELERERAAQLRRVHRHVVDSVQVGEIVAAHPAEGARNAPGLRDAEHRTPIGAPEADRAEVATDEQDVGRIECLLGRDGAERDSPDRRRIRGRLGRRHTVRDQVRLECGDVQERVGGDIAESADEVVDPRVIDAAFDAHAIANPALLAQFDAVGDGRAQPRDILHVGDELNGAGLAVHQEQVGWDVAGRGVGD